MNPQVPNPQADAQLNDRIQAQIRAQRHHLALAAAKRMAQQRIGPCYFLKLPKELRQEIFKYLILEQSIASEITQKLTLPHGIAQVSGSLRQKLPMRLADLLIGFNREVYVEIKDVFYSRARFDIDISRDGVTLCEWTEIGPRATEATSH